MQIESNNTVRFFLLSVSVVFLATTGTCFSETEATSITSDPQIVAAADISPHVMNGQKHPEDLTAQENKVTDDAKNVVKQLGTVDSVNLDDLNTARQTVVKLEALIDIEKHLAELDKIRDGRHATKPLASVIPASALTPPPPSAMPKIQEGMMESNSPSPSSRSEVSRIIGAGGHYMAVVQGKTVRVGDKLSDGSAVVAIMPREVDVKSKDGVMRRLMIKGVDQVFGSTL